MSPTTLTRPLAHRPETQNKAQPGSEHPTRHWAVPKANRPTGRNQHPPPHPRPNGETTTSPDHRGIKKGSHDHPKPKRCHAPAPTARSRRHVSRPGSPPFEPQSSPTPPWRKHPQPVELHPWQRSDASDLKQMPGHVTLMIIYAGNPGKRLSPA